MNVLNTSELTLPGSMVGENIPSAHWLVGCIRRLTAMGSVAEISVIGTASEGCVVNTRSVNAAPDARFSEVHELLIKYLHQQTLHHGICNEYEVRVDLPMVTVLQALGEYPSIENFRLIESALSDISTISLVSESNYVQARSSPRRMRSSSVSILKSTCEITSMNGLTIAQGTVTVIWQRLRPSPFDEL